ncbi:MAG: 4a-hydroxytetrahydrobiopterin dehydratase, partial [Deltaproteobacteria bacterium]|nr:4a-hydroxytetrahydrobiopterin dehydratase [Deltaproteobacteria bacterium]
MKLTEQKCEPCSGIGETLSPEEAGALLRDLPEWSRRGDAIERIILCKDFAAALALINRVGAIAEQEGHHPDIFLHRYKRVRFTLSTHAVGGLTHNDFILAAKIDALFAGA